MRFLSKFFNPIKVNPTSDAEKVEVKEDYRVYRIGGGWGNSITWYKEYDQSSNVQEVMGFKSVRPRVGDLLLINMQSGKKCLFIFAEVELCRDPRDMFFATVQAMGYTTDFKWFEEKLEPAYTGLFI